jgi:excisionase family DNA binding protein
MASSEPAPRRERRRSVEDEGEPAERPEDVLLTTAQVAQMLQLTTKSVLDMVNAGILPAHRLPGMRQFRFFRQAILDAVAANPFVPGELRDEDAEETGTVTAER